MAKLGTGHVEGLTECAGGFRVECLSGLHEPIDRRHVTLHLPASCEATAPQEEFSNRQTWLWNLKNAQIATSPKKSAPFLSSVSETSIVVVIFSDPTLRKSVRAAFSLRFISAAALLRVLLGGEDAYDVAVHEADVLTASKAPCQAVSWLPKLSRRAERAI